MAKDRAIPQISISNGQNIIGMLFLQDRIRVLNFGSAFGLFIGYIGKSSANR
jgi:hypothetical protein